MRGVDLRRFEFDYDLTWAAFFLDPQGRVMGRFGGRDARSPDTYLTASGLRRTMQQHLEKWSAGRREEDHQPASDYSRPEEYPTARRLRPNSCIHCHQIHEFQQDMHFERGTWRDEMFWIYPPPENLGWSIDPEEQNRVADVHPGSPADRAGLRTGAVLREVAGRAVFSYADVQFALHKAPPSGRLFVRWFDGTSEREAEMRLPPGWRESDISWRASMWNIPPAASVYGVDLEPAEKIRLGLKAGRLAFSQGSFVPTAAQQAGIRPGDIIIGADGKELEMTMAQFNVWVRRHYRVGDTITYDVVRDGKRLKIPVQLPRKSY